MAPRSTLPTIDVHLSEADADAALREDARRGLTATPKVLLPQWLYDARGSELFEQITAQPEYYPFVAERDALALGADDVARLSGADTFVELGSGSSTKSTLLLDALSRTGRLRHYVPVDVSAAALEDAVPGLVANYPDLDVHGVVGDFIADLRSIPRVGKRLVVLLGGTIGNFEPEQRRAFLEALSDTLDPGEHFLVGTDLIKDEATLVAAYDDAAGVTAAFELNALTVLNRALGADFDVDGFSYVAAWVPQSSRIEMRVKARRPMTVRVPALDLVVDFADGEEMRTEISTKFTRETIAAELDAAQFDAVHWTTDPAGRFGVTLARRRGSDAELDPRDCR